jgi:hypothetical protein
MFIQCLGHFSPLPPITTHSTLGISSCFLMFNLRLCIGDSNNTNTDVMVCSSHCILSGASIIGDVHFETFVELSVRFFHYKITQISL